MVEINEPLQPDEEGTEPESDVEDDDEEPTPPPVPSTSRSIIKSQPCSPMYNVISEEVVPNETSVSPFLFHYFINLLKRGSLV